MIVWLVSPGKTETKGKVGFARFGPVLIANQQEICAGFRPIVAAAYNPPLRIRPVPVKAHFWDITAHVKKAQSISSLLRHRMRGFPTIPRIPDIISNSCSCYSLRRIASARKIPAGMIVW